MTIIQVKLASWQQKLLYNSAAFDSPPPLFLGHSLKYPNSKHPSNSPLLDKPLIFFLLSPPTSYLHSLAYWVKIPWSTVIISDLHTPSTPLSLFHFLLLIQENSNIALIKLSLFQALSRAAECGWEKTHRCAAGPDFTFLMSSGLFHCLIIKLHLLGLFTFCYSRWLLRAFSVIFKPQPLYPLPPKFTVSWWWSCILYTEKKKIESVYEQNTHLSGLSPCNLLSFTVWRCFTEGNLLGGR